MLDIRAEVNGKNLYVSLFEEGKEMAKITMYLWAGPYTHSLNFIGGVFEPDLFKLKMQAFRLHAWAKENDY